MKAKAKTIRVELAPTKRTDLMCVGCSGFMTEYAIVPPGFADGDAAAGVHRQCIALLEYRRPRTIRQKAVVSAASGGAGLKPGDELDLETAISATEVKTCIVKPKSGFDTTKAQKVDLTVTFGPSSESNTITVVNNPEPPRPTKHEHPRPHRAFRRPTRSL